MSHSPAKTSRPSAKTSRPSGWRRLRIVAALLPSALASCGGQSSGGTTAPPTPSAVDNVLPIVVGSGPTNNTVNGLYASVTVCVPGSSTCQTIDNVQVDTGSIGLRLLASALTLSLPPVTVGSSQRIGNCASFADQSYTWGPLVSADVQLAGEKAVSVPIQLIGAAGFPQAPAECSNGGTAAHTPDALSANGLLGVGVFRQDCGPACSSGGPSLPAVYFDCAGRSCTVAPVPLADQLQNPVWLFPQDNSGLVVSLPAVPASGAPSVAGSLIFGIATQPNNALGSARVYTTDGEGNFSTAFKGRVYSSSFLDTGSNGIFFLDPATIGLPACPGADSPFSCPPAAVAESAINTGTNGATGTLTWNVANAERLFATGDNALVDLAGPDTGEFDWGLPFFFGRNTFIGIESQATPAGSGPFWAY